MVETTRRTVASRPAFCNIVGARYSDDGRPWPAIISKVHDGPVVLVDLTLFNDARTEPHRNVRWFDTEDAAQKWLSEVPPREDLEVARSLPRRLAAYPV